MNLTALLHHARNGTSLPALKRPYRFLLIQIAGIGDLVLATPALEALRERFPTATIDLLTSPRAVDLLKGHPAVDDVFSFDIARLRKVKITGMIQAYHQAYRKLAPLRWKRYDALLSLNNISTTKGAWTLGMMMMRLRVPLWYGRNTDSRASYFDDAINDNSRDPVPEALTKLRVVGRIGADSSPRPATLHLREDERSRVKEILGDNGKVAAILPGANVPCKQWPAVRFAKIAMELKNMGYRIVLLGGNNDSATAERLVMHLGFKVLNLCGTLTLRETAAVLEQSWIVVTNDTGPMHMAAAVGTPLCAIYGPSNSYRYRPWTDEALYRILHHILPCNPCDYRNCPMDTWCMELVTEDEVMGKIRELVRAT